MADSLTQLQDAIDQLSAQFLSTVNYVHLHHDYALLNSEDQVRPSPKNDDGTKSEAIDPHPKNDFAAGITELAQDLILKQAQIQLLISSLPGLENSESDQEKTIMRLQKELNAEEERRQAAMKEKEIVLEKLEAVIKGIRRP